MREIQRGDDSDNVSAIARMTRDTHDKFQLKKLLKQTRLERIIPRIFPHQRCIVFAMMLLENGTTRKPMTSSFDENARKRAFRELVLPFEIRDDSKDLKAMPATLSSTRIGLLADQPGSGKSLCILTAALEIVPKTTDAKQLQEEAFRVVTTKHTLSDMTTLKLYPDLKPSDIKVIPTTIIIVPRALVKQWEDYVNKETTSKEHTVLVGRAKNMQKKTSDLLDSDIDRLFHKTENNRPYRIAIIDETTLLALAPYFNDPTHVFQRVVVDEADTINLSPSGRMPHALFTWYVTATPLDLLQGQCNGLLKNIFYRPTGSSKASNAQINGNTFEAAKRLIVRCKTDFVQECMCIPPHVQRRRTAVESWLISQLHQHQLLPINVIQMLDSNDTKGAIRALGCETAADDDSVVFALIRKNEEELLKKKNDKPKYAGSPDALNALDQSIADIEKKISIIRDRVKESDVCPISMEQIRTKAVVKCCHNAFELDCLVRSLSRNTACPMCRTAITSWEDQVIVADPNSEGPNKRRREEDENEEEEDVYHDGAVPSKRRRLDEKIDGNPDKPDVLVDEIRKAAPGSRILVLSKNDMKTFISEVNDYFGEQNVKCYVPKGKTSSIEKVLLDFKNTNNKPHMRHVLFLKEMRFGAGLNLTSATHILTVHATEKDRYEQLVGRAQRPGRKNVLQVVNIRYGNREVDYY